MRFRIRRNDRPSASYYPTARRIDPDHNLSGWTGGCTDECRGWTSAGEHHVCDRRLHVRTVRRAVAR